MLVRQISEDAGERQGAARGEGAAHLARAISQLDLSGRERERMSTLGVKRGGQGTEINPGGLGPR